MTSGRPLIKQEWAPLFFEFIKYIRINSKEVQAIDEHGAPLSLWPGQKVVIDKIIHGLERGIHTFFFGKARQQGCSTLIETVTIFWLATHDSMMGAYVIDKGENIPGIRDKIRRYFESFPPGFFGKKFQIIKDNDAFMLFSNGSRLDFLVAGVGKKETNWGEGKGYTYVHLCMAKGSPVITENGKIKNIEDVKIGEHLLTHTGKATKVIDVLGQSGKGKPMVEIRPWLGQAIRYTTWHKIPTQRGLIQAGELREEDLLVMPIRKITNFIRSDNLPLAGKRRGEYYVDKSGKFTSAVTQGATARKQEDWVLMTPAGSEKTIEFTEEIGFFVGYYLAEGCLIRDQLGRGCGITFARHRDESSFANRAVAAVKHLITGTVTTRDRKDSLTSTDSIYCSPLARWIESKFGAADDKFIPDEVFSWGEDFCRGLLCGILSGDGSKRLPIPVKCQLRGYKDTYSRNGKKIGAPRQARSFNKKYGVNAVIFPSIRSSFATQIRDIAASLGYGWASLYYKNGGEWYGRNCKPIWRLHWNGEAAYKLRELMGLTPVARKGHNFTQKYIIDGDRVLIKIKSIRICEDEEEVWDISVDHSDHTFRTPYMSTSNTEVAKYGNPDGLASFRSTLSEANPDRLFIYESTSKGVNHWKTLLEEFKRDEFNKAWAFIGWWGNPYNVIKENQPAFGVYGAAEPDPLEQELIDKVKKDYGFKVSQEQLAWYRHKHSEISASDAAMKQNLPWCIEESFVLTGHSFFPMHMLQDEMERCRTTGYKGFRYLIGNDFWSVVCEQIHDDDRQREIVLKVWEEPDDDGIYAIGCDPAYGRSEDKDRHSISVWRCFGDKIVQVAEYADNETSTRQCAWVLAHLAGAYRNCVVNVEAAPGPGGVIMNELENLREQIRIDPKFDSIDANKQNANWSDFLSTSRWYIFKKPDHFAPGFVKGWESNFRTKVQLMEQMRDKFVTGNMIVQSFSLIDEMTNVIRNGDSIGAPESAYDDRVIAAALANRAWMDSLMMSLLGQGETYEQYLRVKNGEPIDKGSKFMSNVIREFFLNAEEKADVPQIPPHQQWLYDKGLL